MKAAAESEGRQLRSQASTSAVSTGSGTSASRKRRGAAEQEEAAESETTSSTSHGQLSGGEEENTPRSVSSSMRERFGFHPRESKRGRQEETEEEEEEEKQQTEETREEEGEQESLASVQITGETSTSVAAASEAEVPAEPPLFGEWADTTKEATKNDIVPVTSDNEQKGRFEILTAWLAGEIEKYKKAPAERDTGPVFLQSEASRRRAAELLGNAGGAAALMPREQRELRVRLYLRLPLSARVSCAQPTCFFRCKEETEMNFMRQIAVPAVLDVDDKEIMDRGLGKMRRNKKNTGPTHIRDILFRIASFTKGCGPIIATTQAYDGVPYETLESDGVAKTDMLLGLLNEYTTLFYNGPVTIISTDIAASSRIQTFWRGVPFYSPTQHFAELITVLTSQRNEEILERGELPEMPVNPKPTGGPQITAGPQQSGVWDYKAPTRLVPSRKLQHWLGDRDNVIRDLLDLRVGEREEELFGRDQHAINGKSGSRAYRGSFWTSYCTLHPKARRSESANRVAGHREFAEMMKTVGDTLRPGHFVAEQPPARPRVAMRFGSIQQCRLAYRTPGVPTLQSLGIAETYLEPNPTEENLQLQENPRRHVQRPDGTGQVRVHAGEQTDRRTRMGRHRASVRGLGGRRGDTQAGASTSRGRTRKYDSHGIPPQVPPPATARDSEQNPSVLTASKRTQLLHRGTTTRSALLCTQHRLPGVYGLRPRHAPRSEGLPADAAQNQTQGDPRGASRRELTLRNGSALVCSTRHWQRRTDTGAIQRGKGSALRSTLPREADARAVAHAEGVQSTAGEGPRQPGAADRTWIHSGHNVGDGPEHHWNVHRHSRTLREGTRSLPTPHRDLRARCISQLPSRAAAVAKLRSGATAERTAADTEASRTAADRSWHCTT